MKKILFSILFIFACTQAYSAVLFDKVDDIIDCGSDSTLDDQEPFTVFAWVNPISSGENAFGRMVVKDLGTGSAGMWNFSFSTTGGANRVQFSKDYDGASDLTVITATNTLTLYTWQPVLVTWDGTATAATGVHIYTVGGVEASYATQTDGTGSKVSDASNDFCIGNRTGTERTWDGQITEVAFWNKVLSRDEIRKLCTSRLKGMPLQISPSNLRGYWPLDDFSNQSVIVGTGKVMDRGPFKNNGTPSNSPISRAEQILSYAA